MTWPKIRYLLRNICALSFIFVAVPALAEGKLVFATHTRPPLSLYLTEVIQEALKDYSIEVDIIEMAGSRVIVEVNNGKFDGDLARVRSFHNVSEHNTSSYLRVKEPLVLIELVMITLKQRKINYPITWETINLGRVAYQRGSKTIRNHLDIRNRVAVSSSQQALEMVANKRVDSAVMFASVAKELMNQSPKLKEKLVIQIPSVTSFHLYTYLNKKHALLIPKLELSLKKLKTIGFLENTATKYQVTAGLTIAK